jgi:hypothetical protein
MPILYIEPGSGSYLPQIAIALIIGLPIITYIFGFKNGKREGERIQLQKQVDEKNKN